MIIRVTTTTSSMAVQGVSIGRWGMRSTGSRVVAGRHRRLWWQRRAGVGASTHACNRSGGCSDSATATGASVVATRLGWRPRWGLLKKLLVRNFLNRARRNATTGGGWWKRVAIAIVVLDVLV